MSNSTKSMLTKMNPNIKLTRATENSSAKKPAAQKSGSKPTVENPASKVMSAPAPMPATLKPKMPTNLDKPTNEMQNLMEMCLSPQNNKKPKPGSSKT